MRFDSVAGHVSSQYERNIDEIVPDGCMQRRFDGKAIVKNILLG